MSCSTNNQASTVYELFINAIQQYHVPSRVRSDQGRENILVAQHMIERRGADRRSMIVGSSIHNQRIERLWRDMHHGVTKLFYRLFYFLEENNQLDPLNEQHLYALHYVFVPRINHALNEFKNAWNHHGIRSAHNRSPYQLFTAGMLLLQHSQLTAMDFFTPVDDFYGIDEDGPEPDDEASSVVVPQLNFQINAHNLCQLRNTVNPLAVSENFGIDLYENVIRFISQL